MEAFKMSLQKLDSIECESVYNIKFWNDKM